jgi:hypothetical protein
VQVVIQSMLLHRYPFWNFVSVSEDYLFSSSAEFFILLFLFISYVFLLCHLSVSEAGIVILPQPSYGSETEPPVNMEGDTQDTEREVVKWPQKPVLLETDMFEVDDSWHDAPPEGFNIDVHLRFL